MLLRFSRVTTLRSGLLTINLWFLLAVLTAATGPVAEAAPTPTYTCGSVPDPAQDRSASIGSEQDGITAINAARNAEGLGAVSLPGDFYSRPPAERILILFNQERQVRGLSTFGQNDLVLGQVALNHSQILIDFNLFAHDDAVDGTFSNRVSGAPGVTNHYSGLGEIIAGAPFSTYMVWLWMYADSTSDPRTTWGHRHNILGCYTHVGIGYTTGGAYGAIATGDFLKSNGSYSPAGSVDTTKPSLTLSQPTFNSRVSTTLNVQAVATDGESGMRHVVFFIDNGNNFSGTDVAAATAGANNTYTKQFSGLSAGNHTLTAVAVDNNNNYNRSDVPIRDTANDPPPAPTNLTAATVSMTQINLSWQASNATQNSFELQRSLDRSSWTTIPIAGAATTTYQDTGLNPCTTYYYQIRAIASNGASPFSNQASAMTYGTPPATPTGLTATRDATYGFSTINVSWTAGTGCQETSFELQRKTGGGSWATITTTGAGVTSFKDQNLTASTTYNYQVRAVNGVGASAYSTTATASTAALPTVDFTVDDPYDDGVSQRSSPSYNYSLSYALRNTQAGHSIIFSVSSITVSGPLPVPTNAGIYINPTGNCSSPVTLQGATTLDGLKLSGGAYLRAMTIRGFGGRQLVGLAGNNHFSCVKVSKS